MRRIRAVLSTATSGATDAVIGSAPVATPLHPASSRARLGRAVVALRREGPLVFLLGIFAAALVVMTARAQIVQDSWLTLVGGREIAHHGLFVRDGLTSLTLGKEWIDQQWLAQLAFYKLTVIGGLKLAMLVHFALLLGAFSFAVVVARGRGAGPLAIGWIGALAFFVAPWGWHLRAQNFAYPLFVLLLAMLLRDRNGPTRRTLLVIPLLVLWANFHGSVLMGVAITCLYALLSGVSLLRARVRDRRLLLCAGLAAGALLAVVATPYGLDVIGYYRSLLMNPDIKQLAEWRPAFSYLPESAPFFIFVALAVGLFARYRKRFTAFEVATLAFTALAAIQATRNVVWFDYAALMIVPAVISAARPLRPKSGRLPTRLFLVGAAVFAVLVVGAAAGRSSGWYDAQWRAAAADRVAAEVAARPATQVWANEVFADWLLWKRPSLAGHIAYDARFELIPHRSFQEIARFTNPSHRGWHRFVDRYELVVLATKDHRRQIAGLLATGGRRVVYRDPKVTILGRR